MLHRCLRRRLAETNCCPAWSSPPGRTCRATHCMLRCAPLPHQTHTFTPPGTHSAASLQRPDFVLGGFAGLRHGSPAAASSRHGAGSRPQHLQPGCRCPASIPRARLEGRTAISRRMRATRRPDAARQRGGRTPHAAPDVAWEPADRSQPWWARNMFVRNAELLQRLAWTMLLAMLMRAGCFVPLPDVARSSLPANSGGQCAVPQPFIQSAVRILRPPVLLYF